MIDIGKIVYKTLKDNNIESYPIVLPENTALPAVIYERSFSINNTKDGRGIDNNSVDVYIMSEDYKESVTLSLQIVEWITSIKGTVLETRVYDSNLIAGAELYNSGVYIQKLTFEILTAS